VRSHGWVQKATFALNCVAVNVCKVQLGFRHTTSVFEATSVVFCVADPFFATAPTACADSRTANSVNDSPLALEELPAGLTQNAIPGKPQPADAGGKFPFVALHSGFEPPILRIPPAAARTWAVQFACA